MSGGFTEERHILIQIAEQLEDAILSGVYPEDGQIPSITEYSVEMCIRDSK